MSVLVDPIRAASSLRAIEQLARRPRLRTQAIHLGGDKLMPGGHAMVALAGTADLEQWAEQREAAEHQARARAHRYGLDLDDVWPDSDDEDTTWEPPLQTLRYWSETWRTRRGMAYPDLVMTVASEAAFLRNSLDWAQENEPRLAAFVKDITDLRVRLETLLSDGDRPVMRGAPCLYDECRGSRLIRTTIAATDPKTKRKYWRLTDWHCVRCRRSWSEAEYQRNVFAAIHREKTVTIDIADPNAPDGWHREVWCLLELAAHRVGRPASTVRVWLHRQQIAEACITTGRRTRFVRLADVEARDQLARERWARRLEAQARKAGTQLEHQESA